MMQGRLDMPPIVVRSSQRTSLLLLIGSMVLVAASLLAIRGDGQTPTMGYLGVVFFGLGVLLFAWRLIRPDIPTIAPDGITLRQALKRSHFKWGDVHGFRAYAPSGRSLAKHIGFDFTENFDGRAFLDGRAPRRTVKVITGVEGSLGGGCELRAVDLADLLNDARARWISGPSDRKARQG